MAPGIGNYHQHAKLPVFPATAGDAYLLFIIAEYRFCNSALISPTDFRFVTGEPGIATEGQGGG